MSITFNIQQGGLGRRLPGLDHVSGFVFAIANADLPAGFTTSDRIKKVESLVEAEALGITATASPATVKALHYHVQEFFFQFERKTQSIGELWIHIYDSAGSFAEANITDLQTAASGRIRQFYAFTNVTFAASLVTTAGTAAATMLANKEPAIIVVGADLDSVAIGSLTTVRGLDTQFVSVDFAQDGTSEADAIATALTTSLGAGGTILGITAAANVALNIGWVREFDLSDKNRWQTIKFANGDLFADASAANLASLVTLGYIFVRTRQGASGAFFDDSPQAVAADNDFAFIENSRTIQKAIREINAELVPFINAPLQVNASDGTLTETTIFELESVVFNALNRMGAALEISVDPATGRLPNNAVFIDPDQDVLATSTVNIIVRIVPLGVQRETVVNIGFTPLLAA